MMDLKDDDPLVGKELIRVQIERYEVHLMFERQSVQLWGAFRLRDGSGVISEIDPSNRTGDLRALWEIIGDKVRELFFANYVRMCTGIVMIEIDHGYIGGRILNFEELLGACILDEF